jgi:hypothetical protein
MAVSTAQLKERLDHLYALRQSGGKKIMIDNVSVEIDQIAIEAEINKIEATLNGTRKRPRSLNINLGGF